MSDFENNNYQEAATPASDYTTTQSQNQYADNNQYMPAQPAPNAYDYDSAPISMWGYLGYLILFAIPCVNLICAIIFAVGGSKNVNVRNFGRGQLLYFGLSLILSIVMTIVMGGAIVSMMGEMTSIMNDPYMYY